MSEQEPDDRESGNGDEDRAEIGSPSQRGQKASLIGFFLRSDEEGSEDRENDTYSGEDKGDYHSLDRSVALERDSAERDRRNKRPEIGLVKIGAHTGNVSDIISDIVCDNGGVAGVILGNSRFNFSDKVGTDVLRLSQKEPWKTRPYRR